MAQVYDLELLPRAAMSSPAFDPDVLRATYSRMPIPELIGIVSIDAASYEEDAIELARAELEARGVVESELPELTRDVKAERYDDLVAQTEERKAPLATWMYLVCLIESNAISFWILIYLAFQGRTEALKQALWAIAIGWAFKLLLMVLLSHLF